MICFDLSIKNIFHKTNRTSFINHLYNKYISITNYKNFEIEIYKDAEKKLFSLLIDLNWYGSDHCGPQLEISILGFYFNIKIYDSRHWDYDTNSWENNK